MQPTYINKFIQFTIPHTVIASKIYIYILQHSVHYWSSKKQQPNLKRNTKCTVTYPYPYTTVLFLVVKKVI